MKEWKITIAEPIEKSQTSKSPAFWWNEAYKGKVNEYNSPVTVGTEGDLIVPERFENVMPVHGMFYVKNGNLWYKNLGLSGTGVIDKKRFGGKGLDFVLKTPSEMMVDENIKLYLGALGYEEFEEIKEKCPLVIIEL